MKTETWKLNFKVRKLEIPISSTQTQIPELQITAFVLQIWNIFSFLVSKTKIISPVNYCQQYQWHVTLKAFTDKQQYSFLNKKKNPTIIESVSKSKMHFQFHSFITSNVTNNFSLFVFNFHSIPDIWLSKIGSKSICLHWEKSLFVNVLLHLFIFKFSIIFFSVKKKIFWIRKSTFVEKNFPFLKFSSSKKDNRLYHLKI